jgi:hypothetical protein
MSLVAVIAALGPLSSLLAIIVAGLVNTFGPTIGEPLAWPFWALAQLLWPFGL